MRVLGAVQYINHEMEELQEWLRGDPCAAARAISRDLGRAMVSLQNRNTAGALWSLQKANQAIVQLIPIVANNDGDQAHASSGTLLSDMVLPLLGFAIAECGPGAAGKEDRAGP